MNSCGAIVVLYLTFICQDLGLMVNAKDSYSKEASFQSASAYCMKKECKYVFGKLDWDNAAAVATFNDTLLSIGWGILDISAGFNKRFNQSNEDIMFAAGFVEGILTAKHMESQFTNAYNVFSIASKPILEKKLRQWFINQRKWADYMIDVHKGSSPLWRHTAYIFAQLDGLFAGYQSIKGTNKGALDFFAVNFLQANGDLLDLTSILDPKSITDWTKLSLAEARRYFYNNSHCSVLIKLLPGFENMFMSHTSWFPYEFTNRIFKHYNFNVDDPATAVKRLSFASYPGYLESLDDFYLLGNEMVMLQTTNHIFNTSLYSLVTVNSLLAWQRVRIANMMSHNGEEWTQVIAQYNSGTYNNQYMVIDLKNVELKAPLPDNTLWVAEQIPGLVVAEDLTSILRAGYFASYNIPFFEEIYNKSGYPAFVKKMGDEFSYQLAPRAKIFRRDQGNVINMETMKKIMRYNDFHHDPYSAGNPVNSICARRDLDPFSPLADGCYDTKVSDFHMAKAFQADIINGPTLGTGLPPFSWTERFENDSHVGLPLVYNFSFIRTQPSLNRT